MLFHTFNSREERREYGGSCFVEIQFCDMPFQTAAKELVAVENIQNWKNDSLYVYMDGDDGDAFCQEYCRIFDYGIYNNLKTEVFNLFGINYYAPAMIDLIIEKLREVKPTDYEVLLSWLIRAKAHNGFYVLGV